MVRFVDRSVSFEQLPAPCAPPTVDHITLTTEIMRLPRKQMEAVLLYYYQHMKIKEIAQALKVSPAAISARLNKARKRLHNALKGGVGYES